MNSEGHSTNVTIAGAVLSSSSMSRKMMKKLSETRKMNYVLSWTIQVIFSIFRLVIGLHAAFWRSGVTLENIEYCTEYDLEIHLKGKKKGTTKHRDNIGIMQQTLTKQEPSKFVIPKVTIFEEYTSLTCSAR